MKSFSNQLVMLWTLCRNDDIGYRSAIQSGGSGTQSFSFQNHNERMVTRSGHIERLYKSAFQRPQRRIATSAKDHKAPEHKAVSVCRLGCGE